MTPEIALTLGIVVGALVLFGTEKLRVDVVALMVLLAVALTGLVGPEEVFAGFSNPAVITVWAVYIVSGGLFNTGVADILGRFILRFSGNSEVRLIAGHHAHLWHHLGFRQQRRRSGHAAAGRGQHFPPDAHPRLQAARSRSPSLRCSGAD